MNLWDKSLKKFLPFKSEEEYKGSKGIHINEIKIYRKQWQYILGMILFFLPLWFLLIKVNNWYYRTLLIAIMMGEVLIRDTITEHYYL